MEFNPGTDLILEKAIQSFNAAEAAEELRELVRKKVFLKVQLCQVN